MEIVQSKTVLRVPHRWKAVLSMPGTGGSNNLSTTRTTMKTIVSAVTMRHKTITVPFLLLTALAAAQQPSAGGPDAAVSSSARGPVVPVISSGDTAVLAYEIELV